MNNPRVYGHTPYRIAVVHGGPGAAGEMAEVATRMGATVGVLEPLQTERTVAGQIRELHELLVHRGEPPFAIVGFSWGALLALLTAAEYPTIANKLILVGTPPLSEIHVASIVETRFQRFSAEEWAEWSLLSRSLSAPNERNKNRLLARVGELCARADAYDPVSDSPVELDVRYDIHDSVWREVTQLRQGGAFRTIGTRIRCPIVAIHGDHDPHPASGFVDDLSSAPGGFRFIWLEKCGHQPWRERAAQLPFYEILEKELRL